MCSHSSPDRERRTVPLKRSTADSSIYAGPRWDSATSRITSRGVCSSPVASDRFYTLNYDEPEYGDGELFHIMPFTYFSDLMEVYILPVHGKTLFSITGKTSGRKCDYRCWEAEEEECVCQCAGEFHKGANSNGIE